MDIFTLSSEQENAIKYNKPGPYAIKGVAGSGKTTVGLHRISTILNKDVIGDESMLIVTYHKTLVNYLEYLIDKNTDDSNLKLNWDSINYGAKYKIKTIDQLMHRKYLSFIQNNDQYSELPIKVSTNKEIDSIFMTAFEKVKNIYPNTNIFSKGNYYFLKNEVDYINSCRISTRQDYQVFTRNGRNKFSDQRKNLPKKSITREAIFALRTKYISILLKNNKMDWPVKRRIALQEVINNPPKQFTHLIIDESQDLDKTRIDFLKHFLTDQPSASATFLYDNSQSIYVESWLGNGHGFASLGIDIKGKSRILKKNFRTTFEIQDAAQSLLKADKNLKQEVEPVLINKTGIKPFWAHCNSQIQQTDYIIDAVLSLTEHLNMNDIIIASRTRSELIHLENELKSKGVSCKYFTNSEKTFGHNQVRLMTLHSVKGLESKAVIIANICEGNIPRLHHSEEECTLERKLLYVGMTRASQYLYLTSFDTPSPFLQDIEEDKLKCVDLNKHVEFQPIEDPEISKKITKSIDDINNAIEAFDHAFNTKINVSSDYRKVMFELGEQNQEIKRVYEDIIELEVHLSNNSSSYSILQDLLNIAAEKKELANKRMYEKISAPIDFKNIEDDLIKRFNNFSDASIKSIATAQYLIQSERIKNSHSQIDWGACLMHFSKSIEIEMRKLLKKHKLFLDEKKLASNSITTNKSFFDMLKIMEKSGEPLRYIKEELESINFRNLRNKATHKETININQVESMQTYLFLENGVLENINNLLA